MASVGYVTTLLAGIPDPTTRRLVTAAFEHVLGNLRLGVPTHQARAENLQAYWVQTTTPSDTSAFSVTHGITTGDVSGAPHYAIPVLDLSAVGSRVGGLTVRRAADSKRLYLGADAGSTSAPITLLVEG